ncbi:MAG: hypothetical protein COA96_17085 [SAR86 cluster bacterium]|uniref:Peptidase S49 domain-containing protein n=1 Tax=SAR86 cluster bacterium TaxID=2030880 RepID=A0A2A5AGC6_9GAMM|nr:MAG: hypothetical protein COA96_17085 [SAR86 cluster bacterium]
MTTEAPSTDVRVQDIQVDLSAATSRGVDIGAYFDSPWAVYAPRMQGTLNYLKRMDVGLHVGAAQSVSQSADGEDAAPKVQVHHHPTGKNTSVAIISVDGTMMKQDSSLFAVACTPRIRREVRLAANDASVSAIILRIDSPGGTTSGTSDLADDIRTASKQKPVIAFIEDMGASAAYWIASQCDAVYANSRTALIGSIGTFIGLLDQSKQFEAEGIRAVVIKTSELKGTGFQGTEITEEQEAYLQDIVSKVEIEFEQAIKKGRGMTTKQVDAVATGRVYTAVDAMTLGLIDGIESIDAVVARADKMSKKRGGVGTRSADNLIESGVAAADDEKGGEQDKDNPTVDPDEAGQQTGSDTKDTGASGVSGTLETTTKGKANAMSGNNETPETKPEATSDQLKSSGAATAAELKAALPNATGDFIVGQLTKGATMSDATAAYATLMDEQNKVLSEENTALKSAKPGVQPVVGSGGADSLNNGGGDAAAPAAEEVETKVVALMAGGMKRHEAHAKVMRDSPKLRERLVTEANESRRSA